MNIEEFLTTPQEIFNGQPAIELVTTDSGQAKLEEVLAEIELFAKLDYNNEPSIIDNLVEIRDRLGLEQPTNIFQDRVEELLVQNMSADFFEDYISKAILMWRNYKAEQEVIRGQDSSWAAAIEYLICRLNCWAGTQEQIGIKYGVSVATISKKYRKLAVELDSDLNLSMWRGIISLFTS
ncbi:MAG: hypothetical protein ACQEP9_02540 [Bacillota bacterium]